MIRNVTVLNAGHIPSELNEILLDFDRTQQNVGKRHLAAYAISKTTTVVVWRSNVRGDLRVDIVTRAE